jgi:TolB protein
MRKAVAITLTALLSFGLLPTVVTATETFPGKNGKIVFVRRGDVWVTSKSGRNETRLTNAKARDSFPTVSPDGKRIAFTRLRGTFRAAIFTMRIDGTGLKRLTGFRNANVGPSFSPGGERILYTWSSGEDIAQVRIMGRDGTNMKRLTGKRDNFAPVWAPAGKRIAYFNRLGRRPGLYVMKANGSDKKRILVDPLSSLDAWGPARRILYTTADGHVGTIKPDGSGNRILTGGDRWNHSPSYSPDGTQIAFQRCRRSDCRYFVMESDGSKRRISGSTRPSGGPTWSPNGNWIVVPFFRSGKKQWDLRLLTVDGSSRWLTKSGGIKESAAWQAR